MRKHLGTFNGRNLPSPAMPYQPSSWEVVGMAVVGFAIGGLVVWGFALTAGGL